MWASRNRATAPAHLTRRMGSKNLNPPLVPHHPHLAITLLQTPLTPFIWTHAPELAFLQFPWRLLAILAAVFALAIAIALTPLKIKPTPATILALIIAAALTYPAYTAFHQPCDPEDTVKARLALFHSNQGTDPTDEYTPTTADNDSLAQTNPPYWLSPDPNAKAPSNTQPGPAPTHLTINSTHTRRPHPQPPRLSRLANHRQRHSHLTTRITRNDGLIALPRSPPADFTIDITYARPPTKSSATSSPSHPSRYSRSSSQVAGEKTRGIDTELEVKRFD